MKRTVITALLLLLILPLAGCSGLQARSLQAQSQPVSDAAIAEITPQALAVQMTQSAPPLILDVRSAREYEAGHIPGAVNIDYREVRSRLDQLQSFENRPVVLYCERGVRASRAEAVLLNAGFTHLSQLSGHMPAWRAAGLPVEVGSSE